MLYAKPCAKWPMLIFDTEIKYLNGLKFIAFDNFQAVFFVTSMLIVYWFC